MVCDVDAWLIQAGLIVPLSTAAGGRGGIHGGVDVV